VLPAAISIATLAQVSDGQKRVMLVIQRFALCATACLFLPSASAQTATEQPPRDSLATLQSSTPPMPTFARTEDRLTYLRWLKETDRRLLAFVADAYVRNEMAQTSWYEAKRAGLDVSFVLGAIEALSGFRHFAVATNGALGLMAINPTWSSRIGDGNVSKLMHMQSNIRFGCVLLRHYLDRSSGDMPAAMTGYVENNLGLAAGNPQVAAVVNNFLAAQVRWAYVDNGR